MLNYLIYYFILRYGRRNPQTRYIFQSDSLAGAWGRKFISTIPASVDPMSTGNSGSGANDRGRNNPTVPDGDGPQIAKVLSSLKAEGCNLLVVGDAPRRLFTCASASLLGDPDEQRYRVLAITDASPRSVTERLALGEADPDSLVETTEIINHASPPRSVTDAERDADASAPGEIAERRVVDPRLAGLQAEVAESIAAFNEEAAGLKPAQLRVGVDSLDALFDHYDFDVVRQCLRVVTGYVGDYDAMGHYVLMRPREDDLVQRIASEFDAVVEIRAVDSAKRDHDAEERWHIPDRDLTTDWLPL